MTALEVLPPVSLFGPDRSLDGIRALARDCDGTLYMLCKLPCRPAKANGDGRRIVHFVHISRTEPTDRVPTATCQGVSKRIASAGQRARPAAPGRVQSAR